MTRARKASGRTRRTNAERTAATRAAILDATVSCLSELGYGRTTTTEVAARAGVSRGALLHNFPMRSQLVVAAAQHVFDQQVADVREHGAGLAAAADRADAVIEMLFALTTRPTVLAIFEVIAAARTDDELRPAVQDLTARFHHTIREVFGELFPPPEDPALRPWYEAVPGLFLAIVDGTTFQGVAGIGAAHRDEVMELTKYVGHLLLQVQSHDLPKEHP